MVGMSPAIPMNYVLQLVSRTICTLGPKRGHIRFAGLFAAAWVPLFAGTSVGCYQAPDVEQTTSTGCQIDTDCAQWQLCRTGACVDSTPEFFGEAPVAKTAGTSSCPTSHPISCGPAAESGCCPQDSPICCGGRCTKVASQCQDVVQEACPVGLDGCTVCWQGATCPANKPFCCGSIGGILNCSASAAACDGFAKPAHCPDNKPIACSADGSGTCCPEDQPFCCGNGQCYADANECGTQVAELCVDTMYPVNCGNGCCPDSHPYCCTTGDQVSCQSDPHYCGVLQGQPTR